jgi:hypothetical protein
MVERYAHLAPDQLAHAASRLNSMFVGYDSATLHQNEKRLPSLAAAWILVGRAGIEPTTNGLKVRCSNLLKAI